MKIKIAQPLAIHQIGKRPNQEDSIYPLLNTASTKDFLFILCDGMGGHECGEVASGTVIQTISSFIKSRFTPTGLLSEAMLEEAIDAAYNALDEQDKDGTKKMGTTLTFLCFHRGGCTVAHIGDSRIYHIRPNTREILYRSRDHSLIYDLFEIGELTKDEMKTAKNKNVITRVIMAHQERRSKADIVHITDIQEGDYFYLCSDGMLESMEDKRLLDIFGYGIPDTEKRDMLIEDTVDSNDNHSGIIIRIESIEHEEDDLLYPNNEPEARAANKILLAELSESGSVEDTGDSVMVVGRSAQTQQPMESVEEPMQAEPIAATETTAPTPTPADPTPTMEEPAAPDYSEPISEPKRKNKLKSSGTGKIMILAIVTLVAVIAVAIYILTGSGKNDDNNDAEQPPTEQPVIVPPKRDNATPVTKRPNTSNDLKANKSGNSNPDVSEYESKPKQTSSQEASSKEKESSTVVKNPSSNIETGEGGQSNDND